MPAILLTAWAKVENCMQLRRLSRLILILAHLLLGALLAPLVSYLIARDKGGTHLRLYQRIIMWWHGRVCRILNIRIATQGKTAAGPTLFVANHISWLDICVLGTLNPALFLAKANVAGWPLVGWLAGAVGTLFIERGAQGAAAAIAQLSTQLRAGNSVLIFPEGSTTTGHSVRRFYPRLYQAAIETRCQVQALALRYHEPDHSRAVVPFIGDDGFVPHLWRLLQIAEVQVSVTSFTPLATTSHERQTLAAETHRQILAVVAQSPHCAYPDNRAPVPDALAAQVYRP